MKHVLFPSKDLPLLRARNNRIGELSRELEKAHPNKGYGAGLHTDAKTKEQTLARSRDLDADGAMLNACA